MILKEDNTHGLTLVSCARGASRAQEWATKVTDAEDVFCTSGLRDAAKELRDIDRSLAVNITVYFNSCESFPK